MVFIDVFAAVQVCDATNDDSCNAVKYKIISTQLMLLLIKIHHPPDTKLVG